MTRYLDRVCYLAVAATCFVTHNVVLILADSAGYSLPTAMLSSFVIVALLGYVMHSLITFREPLSWPGLQRYVSAMSLTVAAAFAMTWFFKTGLRLPMRAAAPAASVMMLAINFLLSRWAIVAPAKASG